MSLDVWSTAGAPPLDLPLPPGPLAPSVRSTGTFQWGTRGTSRALQSIAVFTDEFREGRAPEYVLAGVEDLSTDLPGVHYFVVYGRLGLFVQIALDDPERAATLSLAAEVQDATIRAAADGLLPAEGSLLVVDARVGLHYWEWVGASQGGSGGLRGALDWLEERRASAQ